jgi:hypothetical protein
MQTTPGQGAGLQPVHRNRSPANNLVDPLNPNLRAESGRSPNDVRDRFVANMVWTPIVGGLRGWWNSLTNGWGISPIFHAQSGLPFTLGVPGSNPAGALSGPLGSGVARLPFLRNTYTYPRPFYCRYTRFEAHSVRGPLLLRTAE